MVRTVRMILVFFLIAVLLPLGCAGARHLGRVGKLDVGTERDGDYLLSISRGGEIAEYHLDDKEAAEISAKIRSLLDWDVTRPESGLNVERIAWDYPDFRARYVATPEKDGSYLIMEWGDPLNWFEFGIVTLQKAQMERLADMLDQKEAM